MSTQPAQAFPSGQDSQSAEALSDMKHWRSLSVSDFATGYGVSEIAMRSLRDRLAENVLRLAGAFTMLAGYVQWFVPLTIPGGNTLQMHLFLTALFVAGGISLFFYASRGFRRILHIDFGQRRVITARVNSNDESRDRRDFPMEDVASIYVRRSDTGSGQAQATLNIRLKSQPQDIILLTGAQAEVETLHDRLCHDVHMALDCGPKRVQQRRNAGSSKPSIRPSKNQAQSRRSLTVAAE